jgi:hypothetical protein
MKLLIPVGLVSLCLSVLSLFAAFFTRKRLIAYLGQAFFILSIAAAALLAWNRHTYALTALFTGFAIIWIYRLISGRMIGSSLN